MSIDTNETDFEIRKGWQDQNDRITVEGLIELEQAAAEFSPQARIKADCELMAKRDEMFDELVEKLHRAVYHAEYSGCRELLARARALQRREIET